MPDAEYEKVHEDAELLFVEGKLDEAERLYVRILEKTPGGYADIHNKLGLIYFQKGLIERAARCFEKALVINPRYTEASLNLVVTYNEMRRFEEAERVFLRAAKVVQSQMTTMDPYIQGKLANEHARLGDTYCNLGRYEEALLEYRQALRLRPEFVDILTRIGIALREKGDTDQAIEYLQKAKAINPSYIPAYIHLGLAHFSLGHTDLAVSEWKAVLRMDPSNRGAQAYLALVRKP